MLPEEITKFVGKVGDITIMEVEKGAIKRYADAVDDHNPLYWDEEYAKNSRYGSIIAPPAFFGWPTTWTTTQPVFLNLVAEMWATMAKAGCSGGLYGGAEYELSYPVRAGDTLEACSRIANIWEREGKSGKLIFIAVETTYTNQNGDLVAKQVHTFSFSP